MKHRAVTFADNVSEPFVVLQAGDYPSRGLEVTEEHLDAMVKNFNVLSAEGVEFSTDFDHSFADGGTSEASGWYRELFRKGKDLFARVEWTDPAKEKIKAGLFKYFSAEFHLSWADEKGTDWGPTLLSGALTNRPFLKRLGAVALNDKVRDAIADDALGSDLRAMFREELEAFGRTPGGVESQGRKTARMADDKTVTLTEADHAKLVEARDQVAALTEKVEELSTKAEALTESVTASNEARENVEKELQAERLTAALSQAKREGRIDASDETVQKWTERTEKLGLEIVRELLQELPAETIPMSERGHGSDKPATVDAPDGVDERAHRAHLRAEEIAAEKEISYEDAASIAFREVYA